MASKNTTAFFLTINLILFGFTVAQPPTCPRDIEACSNVFGLGRILNYQTVRPCCTLVDGLDAYVASVCICDSIKIYGISYPFTVGLVQVLSLCGADYPPPGFRCRENEISVLSYNNGASMAL
ncbi:putative bifunctional inhibitor/plant lipid transfer protein/seed storage helical [Arabidopsis thaliana]|jgi:hypothetical protein|uniref:AT4g22610/F7K2_190 n=4 Tax=Arabidopsis TaxID=3701 RepID=Q9SUV8_ARATH|nr:Bifunctional inhibitor/lipid-transfer protein/seed storage 2S albumin superfamily protein [Arabidopsis thaliana]KAG7616947.1 Bifunctional inhibitor/plant lipid transfer protein/seed storage helical domain [Arabidopsis thaliana x Arabidopsis arenosa]KAG7621424.1 Bifunctional inhibitor/plant lipid transfer protein/seed storage helical domain [Arabidopsis suecica]AAK52992.1 AT4g22610/F7K2_190 [Arabidopsis thaliana]AAM65837.1 unknown [Arabidopsis thaliana]AAM91065.1 AT4g22610/F7K2_190 [Arabidop|eukprot:NP_193992.1 Bifunctional inhibitor/lipid-transfer protein/seed storage 2S albumin superfamily protein [Arabidopsis thaliana]